MNFLYFIWTFFTTNWFQPKGPVIVPVLDEISGITYSKKFPDSFWAQEDGGNRASIYLFGYDGKMKKAFALKNATNADWEDMALDSNKIFIADIGDNAQARKQYNIFYFNEPAEFIDTIYDVNRIAFVYPDRPHDAEAFLVDNISHDILIITKRDKRSLLYKIPYPYKHFDTAVYIGKLKYKGVVSAALSPSGNQVLVKTYRNLFRYKKEDNQPVADALAGKFKRTRLRFQFQGEAITYSNDGKRFFTLSERPLGKKVRLHTYKTKP